MGQRDVLGGYYSVQESNNGCLGWDDGKRAVDMERSKQISGPMIRCLDGQVGG